VSLAARGWWRLVAVLTVSLVVAVLTTRGQVYLPPRAGVLIAGGLVVALALILPPRWRATASIVAAAVAGATAGHVLLRPGMPHVHDLVHLWGIWAYGRCVVAGDLYPLWIPYLGAGIPLFQFYGPVSFLVALPGILLGFSPMGAWKLAMFSGHVLSALSMLAAARLVGVGWRAALLAATAFAFAPWRLATFDYRGAIGEANAFLFMPLIAAASLRLVRKSTWGTAAVLTLSLVALVLTHVVSVLTLAVILLPALAVAAVTEGAAADVRRRLPALLLACLAAAGISAAWWLPVAGELRYTAVAATTADNPAFEYREHGLRAGDLSVRRQWDRVRLSMTRSERAAGDREPMPFYVGAVLVLLALSAPWWSRERRAWGPALGALVGLGMSTAALAAVAGALPLFAPVRFPWRFLSPATVLAVLALALGVETWRRAEGVRAWPALPLLLSACLLWDAAPYTGAADRIPDYRGVVHWYTDALGFERWETSMTPVTVEGLPESGVVRVRDLKLPPSDYETAIDAFFPGYFEWLTPEVYRRYWRTRRRDALAEAGVTHGFNLLRRDPEVQRARSYATLELPGRADPVALPPDAVDRAAGRIRVDTEAGPDGATLVVLEQAFPGWSVRVDDGPWRPPQNRRGFMAVPLEPGRHRIDLAYGPDTPARRAGVGVSLATLALLSWLAVRRIRGRPTS
jgi:hypothetical protein